MDIAIAVEQHFGRLGHEDSVAAIEYGSAATYDALAASWRDARALPTLGELEAAWAAYQARVETVEPTMAELQAQIEQLQAAIAELMGGV